MNILLITDSYPPEIRSASHLMQELAEELVKRGHEITVVTSYPQYNLTQDFRDKVFEEFTVENNVNVIRIKTLPLHKVNYFIRGISQLALPYIFFLKIKQYIKNKIDVVIVYSPPLPLAITGLKVKKRYCARFILNVQDIFPQNAIDLGILKNSLLISFFERMERKIYDGADKITAHSENNMRFLIEKKQLDSDNVSILHNWIDITPYMNEKRTGFFRKEYGLDDKFIFLFAGVIGPSQGLDLIINAARKVREFENIVFLLVGDGTEKNNLIEMAESFSLTNVLFKPFVSKEEYPKLVKDADAGIVCLSNKNKTPVVPGKILGYMAASIPVVAFLNKESDGHIIIEDAKCGYSSASDDYKKAAEIITKIYRERGTLRTYGENGFKYVSSHFAKNICIDNLEKLFLKGG